MISKKITAFSIILLFVALISGLFLVLSNPIKQPENKPDNPNSFAENVTATEFDLDGKAKTIWVASKMVNYIKDNITLFENPRLTLYKSNQPPWYFNADHGKAIHGKEEVFLWGNVKGYQPPGENSHNMTLLSPTMTVYPDQSYAITHDPVVIQKPHNIVHAIGMKIDLKTSNVTLLSQTQANIEKKLD